MCLKGRLSRCASRNFPTRHSACTGVIEAVLSEKAGGSGGIDMIVARHKLETVFSDAALAEAAAVAVSEEEALDRGLPRPAGARGVHH